MDASDLGENDLDLDLLHLHDHADDKGDIHDHADAGVEPRMLGISHDRHGGDRRACALGAVRAGHKCVCPPGVIHAGHGRVCVRASGTHPSFWQGGRRHEEARWAWPASWAGQVGCTGEARY